MNLSVCSTLRSFTEGAAVSSAWFLTATHSVVGMRRRAGSGEETKQPRQQTLIRLISHALDFRGNSQVHQPHSMYLLSLEHISTEIYRGTCGGSGGRGYLAVQANIVSATKNKTQSAALPDRIHLAI